MFCRRWQEVDHDLEDSLAGAVLNPTGSWEEDGDPLGLGGYVK